MPVRPLSRDLLLDPFHCFRIGKAGDGQSVAHNFDDDLAVFVDEMSDVERIFLRFYLNWFVPVSFALPTKWCMPDEYRVGMCHQYAF